MADRHWNGNLITSTRRAPSNEASSGLFNLTSQHIFKAADKWPGGRLSGLIYKYWTQSTTTTPSTQSGFEALFTGTPVGTGTHSTVINWDSTNTRGTKPSYLPADRFSWQVEGTIYIASAGVYAFGTGSDDGNQLTISGSIITSYYGGRGVSGGVANPTDTGQLYLTAGYKTFRYRQQEGAYGDGAYVCWSPPSQSGYAVVPASVFFQT